MLDDILKKMSKKEFDKLMEKYLNESITNKDLTFNEFLKKEHIISDYNFTERDLTENLNFSFDDFKEKGINSIINDAEIKLYANLLEFDLSNINNTYILKSKLERHKEIIKQRYPENDPSIYDGYVESIFKIIDEIKERRKKLESETPVIIDFRINNKTNKENQSKKDNDGLLSKEEIESLFSKKDENPKNIFKQINNETNKINHPKEIKEILDKYIIGQEDAKKTISQVVFNHINIINNNLNIPEQHTFLVGPSGCGKTEILRVLKKELDLDIIIIDCTTISFNGYSSNGGQSLGDLLKNIPPKSIVIFDEFDKLVFKNNENRKDAHLILSEFLKLLEGEKLLLDKKNNFIIPSFLLIFTGAFTNVLNKKNSNNLGFITQTKTKEQILEQNKITIEEMIEAGMMNEVLGRITFIEQLYQLSPNDYLKILKNENGIHALYKKNFKEQYNIDITLTDELLLKIVDDMQASKLGTRELNSKIAYYFNETFYNIPNKNCIAAIVDINNTEYIEEKEI